jgi:predicted amidohydrolase YtcJ
VLKEKEIGSIEAGKFGDLVILDRNPLDPAVRDDELSKLQVMLTMVGGRVVFDAEKDPRPKPRGRRDTSDDR